MAYVSVEVELDEFSDEEISEEYFARGLHEDLNVVDADDDLDNAIYEYRRGNLKEAMIHLERAIPGFRGISEKF